MTNGGRLLTALATGLAMLGGCAEARKMDSHQVLFDGATPPKEMYHVSVVADPFAPPGAAEPAKALQGGPPGPGNTTSANKCSFLNGDGFFTMPRSGRAELQLVVAVRGLTELRILVLSRNPKAQQGFGAHVPAEGAWQTVALTLDPKVFPPGCTVYDITVFQQGQDASAELYVRSVSLKND